MVLSAELYDAYNYIQLRTDMDIGPVFVINPTHLTD